MEGWGPRSQKRGWAGLKEECPYVAVHAERHTERCEYVRRTSSRAHSMNGSPISPDPS